MSQSKSVIDTLRDSILRGGYPNWRTLRGLTNSVSVSENANFTLVMDSNYQCCSQEATNAFERSARAIHEIQEVCFNMDIKDREIGGNLDPFFLAADVCQDFVKIHPFKDGNGRICRLIANAFLIKYAGIVISMGEDDEDRKEYLRIAELSGAGEFEEEARGKLASLFLEKADVTLRRLKEKMFKKL